MKRRAAVLVFLLLGSSIGLALASLAEANFNAAVGFSGRHGFTCTSCHNVQDFGPLGEDEIYDPPAQVTLEGLPVEWGLGEEHLLTITVTGGPLALPEPAPQGGFEIETDVGRFAVPDGMGDLIDVYAEDGRAVTYTAAGTLVRQWQVTWSTPVAPGHDGDPLTSAPEPATFWVAGMAANGNHVVALGMGDGGELGDSVHNITVTVPVAEAAIDAWAAASVTPPVIDAPATVPAFTAFDLSGRHTDPTATHLGFRIDNGGWNRIETPTEWTLRVSGLTPGDHELWLRSGTPVTQSEPVRVTITADAEAEPSAKDAPFPFLMIPLALLLSRRRS